MSAAGQTPSGPSTAGGPGLPQERRLVTDIPAPLSQELLERKRRHVADGVGTALPVFVTAAGGGIVRDVDGNALIDLGSGIAVTTVGNAAPAVVRRPRLPRAYQPDDGHDGEEHALQAGVRAVRR